MSTGARPRIRTRSAYPFERGVLYMSLALPATQPPSCRNVGAEVDGRDRYHPRPFAHHRTVYVVSPRAPRTRHDMTKPQ